MMKNSANIGFIGAGNIAFALMRGLIKSGYDNEKIYVSDISYPKLNACAKDLNIRKCANNTELLHISDIIIFAVKPDQIPAVCTQLKPQLKNTSKTKLIVSVAAGIKTKSIHHLLGDDTIAIVRLMPNTPACIGKSATGAYANALVSEIQKKQIEEILTSIGIYIWVQKESLLDVITAAFGSGPAYFFYVLEIITKATTALGLDEKSAYKLSVQTALGSILMAQNQMEKNQYECESLRAEVTSPNGTTATAMEALKTKNFAKTLTDALNAACARAKSLNAQ